jgi:hypothetical protein
VASYANPLNDIETTTHTQATIHLYAKLTPF